MTKNIDIAIKASIEAGEKILEIYNSAFEVEYKEDNSPLTIADKEANAIIVDYLKETNIPIISEENKQVDYQERKKWSQCWIVDPLDGTKEFIKRNGEFTVNIALVTNGKPEVGVIYVPVSKTLYVGNVPENSVYKHDLNNDKKETLATNNSEGVIRIVCSRSHMSEETKALVESFKNKGKQVELVSKGSSLKFCLVAEGKADMYPRYAPTMEWDTAAGQAICNAVGVEVISHKTNKPLQYNKENLLNPWFTVTNER